MNRKELLTVIGALAMVLMQGSVASASILNLDFVSEVSNRFFPLKRGTKFSYVGAKDGVSTTNETFVT